MKQPKPSQFGLKGIKNFCKTTGLFFDTILQWERLATNSSPIPCSSNTPQPANAKTLLGFARRGDRVALYRGGKAPLIVREHGEGCRWEVVGCGYVRDACLIWHFDNLNGLPGQHPADVPK